MAELERRQFRGHRRFELLRRGFARRRQFARGLAICISRAARRAASAASSASSSPNARAHPSLARKFGAQLRQQVVGGTPYLRAAPRSAKSRSSLRSSSRGSASSCDSSASSSRRASSASAKACSSAGFGAGGALAGLLVHARETFQRRGQRRFRAACRPPAHRSRQTLFGDAAGIHQQRAFGGELLLFARFGAEVRRFSRHGMAQIVRVGRPWRAGTRNSAASARAVPARHNSRGPDCGQRLRGRRKHRAAGDGWPASNNPRSSAWPWISTQHARPVRAGAPTPTGSSLTKARVRPSAASVRRSMISPSAAMPCFGQQAPAPRVPAADRRWRRRSPVRARPHARRAPARAPAASPAHRAGSTCPRRSRPSAR